MGKIMIGFVFVYLDFYLNLGASKIGLLPNFIGFIIMAGGIAELASESGRLTAIRPFVIGMAVYSSILYAMDLFGISVQMGLISILLGIVSTVITLYISYSIIQGIKEIEAAQSRNLNSAALQSTWSLMVVFTIISVVLLWIPMLALISVICNTIVSIVFLVAFNKAKNLYDGDSTQPFVK